MSEQDSTETSPKRHKNRQRSKQDDIQTPVLQSPVNGDKEAWKAYWREEGQPWRTEPEIDTKRQKYLAERRIITPDIGQGIYPFKGEKLSRADVEWLLATLDNGRGPVDWSDESQREREGLDLRGADLRKVDLNHLPLTCLRGGLNRDEFLEAKDHSSALPVFKIAPLLMEGANLEFAQLEGANLDHVRLENASLFKAKLEQASLYGARIEKANLYGVQLKEANLFSAYLKDAGLNNAHLEGANLKFAHLEGTRLCSARLGNANLSFAHLDGADFRDVILCDNQHIGPLLADVQWGNTNLTVIDWSQVTILGDEHQARQKKDSRGKIKRKQMRLSEYRQAVRAHRQLAVVLRDQGLNEDAARFAYRAQILHRTIFRLQREAHSWVQYFFSLFLDLLAGYGYKPWRSFLAYLLVITAFATAYFIIGHTVGPVLSPLGSFVFSMTSFHGRGFFPGGIGLDDPLTVLAAIEAFVGLLIEVTFIATLTRRLFGQ